MIVVVLSKVFDRKPCVVSNFHVVLRQGVVLPKELLDRVFQRLIAGEKDMANGEWRDEAKQDKLQAAPTDRSNVSRSKKCKDACHTGAGVIDPAAAPPSPFSGF